MTPEQMLAQAGNFAVPQPANIDMRRVKPFCWECGARVNLRKAGDAIVFTDDHNKQHVAPLCRRCTASLDAASQEETLRRLAAIRAKVAT